MGYESSRALAPSLGMQLPLSMDGMPARLTSEPRPAMSLASLPIVRPRRLPALFYLHNFHAALEDLSGRYARLLSDAEWTFLHQFAQLPEPSQCLLTRMLMRKGAYFRRATLQYDEVADLQAAIDSLVDSGWLDSDPVLTLEQLHRILRREEWRRTFGSFARRGSEEGAQLALLHPEPAARALSQWNAALANTAVHLVIAPVAKRLQWLYFGNDRQGWDEFVLSDLNIKRYERVPFDAGSCAFGSREEIEHFYRLQECRARLRGGEAAASIVEQSYCPQSVPQWLEARFGELQIRLGETLEEEGSHELALQAYRCGTVEGHIRAARLIERTGRHAEAREEAWLALHLTCSEAQREEIGRIVARLNRRLGEKVETAKRPGVEVIQLRLPKLAGSERVERYVAAQLSTPGGEAFYVENSLFPSLFGLLCWEAIFGPLPGAFFNPFQTGPADLYTPGFKVRRATQFETLFGLLDRNEHEEVIWRNYHDKAGLHSVFVRWGKLKPEILALALKCIPPAHLKLVFERVLADLGNNCSGLPDLVQFWPGQRRYRLFEVKAPGDRLQYNQRRWMQFFKRHDIPAAVCKVAWADSAATS